MAEILNLRRRKKVLEREVQQPNATDRENTLALIRDIDARLAELLSPKPDAPPQDSPRLKTDAADATDEASSTAPNPSDADAILDQALGELTTNRVGFSATATALSRAGSSDQLLDSVLSEFVGGGVEKPVVISPTRESVSARPVARVASSAPEPIRPRAETSSGANALGTLGLVMTAWKLFRALSLRPVVVADVLFFLIGIFVALWRVGPLTAAILAGLASFVFELVPFPLACRQYIGARLSKEDAAAAGLQGVVQIVAFYAVLAFGVASRVASAVFPIAIAAIEIFHGPQVFAAWKEIADAAAR